VGELWVDNTYTDLSTDNPFWDSDANRPKPVRQVISETGTTPLIALPIRGDDAGNNLGSGGDFTVNSGPYTGARGGSEFWARSANFDGSTGYLTRGALSGMSNSVYMSLMVSCRLSTRNQDDTIFEIRESGGSRVLLRNFWISGALDTFRFTADDGDLGNAFIELYDDTTHLVSGVWYNIFISIDMSNSSNNKMILNGVDNSYVNSFTSGSTKLSGASSVEISNRNATSDTTAVQRWEGDIANLYFNTSYIDFSQESNRNLFVDQLGYPKDLTPAIEAGDIADPLIYMKFDDTSALGTNSGTGGNFTVNGDVTDGADVDPNA
jgi:hypothetical protein